MLFWCVHNTTDELKRKVSGMKTNDKAKGQPPKETEALLSKKRILIAAREDVSTCLICTQFGT